MPRQEDVLLLNNIRRILDEKGIKHCKVAAKLGLSNAEFSRMLAGKRMMRTCYIPAMMEVLGVTANDLFADSETERAG